MGLYCSREDIETFLSREGLVNLTEDTKRTFLAEEGVIEDAIAYGSAQVELRLLRRYTEVQLSASVYVTMATVVFASRFIFRRRGRAVPASLNSYYEEVLEELKQIQARTLDLPGANDRYNQMPSMSNMRVDMRYFHAKNRVQEVISSGGQQVRPKHGDPDYHRFPL